MSAQILKTLAQIKAHVAGLERLIAAEYGEFGDRICKPCGTCGKPLTLDSYHVNRSSPDGKSSICKYCTSKHKRIYRQNRIANERLQAIS
jgi:uncharacterized CHY-type Zn-finger protein